MWGSKPNQLVINSDDTLVEDFLMGYHFPAKAWPNSKLMIGTKYEVGNIKEDWGFCVYMETSVGRKVLCYDKTLKGVIEKAKAFYACDHSYENSMCVNCKTHRRFLDEENRNKTTKK